MLNHAHRVSMINVSKRYFSASAATSLARTALYDLHVKYGAKLVDFAGYEMPLVYNGKDKSRVAGGQIAEHKAVREAAGLFDVSHMLQSTFEGPGSASFLEWITPVSTKKLESSKSNVAKSSLSVLLNENGGILDDTIITRLDSDSFYVVTNAGRRDFDTEWIKTHLDLWHSQGNPQVTWKTLDDYSLVALQGPQAYKALSSILPGTFSINDTLKAFESVRMDVGAAKNVNIARAGYTGEDGFEISIPSSNVTEIVESLLDYDPVKLSGLAARDSLRLEAGMCLYGQDIDDTTGVGQANLGWVVDPSRRQTGPGAFIGVDATLKELAKGGSPRKRIGIIVQGKGPAARAHTPIYSSDESTQIGEVTSGLRSPTLGVNIAMGYVQNKGIYVKKNSDLKVKIRDKFFPATVVGLPFVPSKYYR